MFQVLGGECAPDVGRDQAAVLPGGRALRSSNRAWTEMAQGGVRASDTIGSVDEAGKVRGGSFVRTASG